MKKRKKSEGVRKPKCPRRKEDDGHLRESYYHACIASGKFRFQVNSGDVLYVSRYQDVKELAKWMLKAAEYMKSQSKGAP